MKGSSGIAVLVLEGSARECGQVRGEVLKPMILEHICRSKHHLQESAGMHADEYLEHLLEETGFFRAAQRWSPDLVEEVKGIAERAGVDLKRVFALQLLDEEMWYSRGIGVGLSLLEDEQCSGLGVFGQRDAAPVLGHNIELPDYVDGLQSFLQIKDLASGLNSLVLALAGLIGLNGLNNRSIGICCNSLLQLNHSTNGLPVAFVVRMVLSQSTLKDAVGFIRSVRHASGQNYIVGNTEEILDFECSANEVSQFVPCSGANQVYNTNLPLVNDDQGMYNEWLSKLPPGKKQDADAARKNFGTRLQSLKARLEASSEPITFETAKSILASHDSSEHPICRHKKPDGDSHATTIASPHYASVLFSGAACCFRLCMLHTVSRIHILLGEVISK